VFIEKKPKILDIGCGKRKYPSSIGIDKNPDSDADVIRDLNKLPYPFKKNEFDIVYATHVIEHLRKPFKILKEIERILKPGGKFIVRVPHFSCVNAYGNPDHKHYYACESFIDLERHTNFKIEKLKMNYCSYRETLPKKIISGFFSFFANLNTRFCERFWCYWIGGFSEIHVEYILEE